MPLFLSTCVTFDSIYMAEFESEYKIKDCIHFPKKYNRGMDVYRSCILKQNMCYNINCFRLSPFLLLATVCCHCVLPAPTSLLMSPSVSHSGRVKQFPLFFLPFTLFLSLVSNRWLLKWINF